MKLEQVLPSRLRRRVNALSDATSTFGVEGPQIDADVLATIAGACRDRTRLRFAYIARDEKASQRNTEPNAVVYSGHRWYLVAFDLDRDDWRTFRIDRIRGRLRPGERGRRRTVPGGDPAAFVKERLRGIRDGDAVAELGRVRLAAAVSRVRGRIPTRWGAVEADGDDACIVTSRSAWSHGFLVWMATLGEPMEVLGPPELAEAARAIAARLGAAA